MNEGSPSSAPRTNLELRTCLFMKRRMLIRLCISAKQMLRQKEVNTRLLGGDAWDRLENEAGLGRKGNGQAHRAEVARLLHGPLA